MVTQLVDVVFSIVKYRFYVSLSISASTFHVMTHHWNDRGSYHWACESLNKAHNTIAFWVKAQQRQPSGMGYNYMIVPTIWFDILDSFVDDMNIKWSGGSLQSSSYRMIILGEQPHLSFNYNLRKSCKECCKEISLAAMNLLFAIFYYRSSTYSVSREIFLRLTI